MILTAEGVGKRFGGLVAVDNVSLAINQGEIFGLIGPNGAGKTTFLNCISGFYKPEKGTVTFKGQNIVGLSSHQLCHKGIARTFQIVRSFAKLSAEENVKVALTFGRGKQQKSSKSVQELLDFVGFTMPKQMIAENLNTMQLKRLELARALATNCELLLLDEVAAGLTPSELPEFIELIKRIRDGGVTIISIEHVMKFIMEVCDRIAVLQFGKKIAEGTTAEIKDNPKVKEAYLGEELVH
ncbi:ABC transporter ATP-binding protein [Desulfosporosinus sp. PR]|uniref:ABC transporter ATP-binding protein n=1 Tax=Candidatus Desulfosporosinus nitrosoreducens TaxID=3401928 RepID=UPI0027FB8DD3|nr:ABC transporter ATP-binding protein [Desulfosporosinus sp. PR]MDQ7095134.1 ABC transporter ATP-binding protein [Desulfosporosinus sp. PR]